MAEDIKLVKYSDFDNLAQGINEQLDVVIRIAENAEESAKTAQGIAEQLETFGGVFFGICTTAAATTTKIVTTTPEFSSLTDGLTVRVRFLNGTQAGVEATLNVNGTGEKAIKAFQSIDGLGNISGGTDLNSEIVFVYNSSEDVWVMVGSGLAWFAENAYYAFELNDHGLTGNLLIPSFADAAAATTTAVFTSITRDIDNTYGTMTSVDFSAAVITPNYMRRRMISLSFTSGSTATNFGYPTSWYFSGTDCEGGIFVPEASVYYDVIIEYRNGVIHGYVAGHSLPETNNENMEV